MRELKVPEYPLTYNSMKILYSTSLARSSKRDCYVQVDLHGGNNSAVSAQAADSTAYAHRDYLLMYYPDSGLEEQAAQVNYWGEHLPKLQPIKKAVDPDDLFHYPQGVLPAGGTS
ncbi:hypothetical protein VTK56DRAFT_4901 [Thermocarpiscus australiensis]